MNNHTAEPPTMAEIMRDEALAIAVDAVTQGKSVCLPTGTEADVCADIAARQRLGIAKYGTTLRDNPLTRRQRIQHAYEEALDLAVYLKRELESIE